MMLWRPVGREELDLIAASGWTRFPPRLPEQPIFYPVLSFDYAEQIARDWNSKRDEQGCVGFVVAFDVADRTAHNYPEQTAGSQAHRELWVPAEELEAFNDAITTPIRLVARYENGVRVEAA